MNKTELIAAAAEGAGLTKKDTERVINAAIDAVTAALVKGDRCRSPASAPSRPRSGKPALASTPTPRKPSRSPLPAFPPSRQARL